VVPDPAPPEEPSPEPAEPAQGPPAAPVAPTGLAAAVRDALGGIQIGNPARPALEAIALRLAEAAEHDAAREDPRVLATVTRELRATLAELAPSKEGGAADADPFGLADLRPTLVDPAAG
jgi:hypothetical protein